MTRQFVACKFRSSDTRFYTFHNDGEPVAIGDSVIAETARGQSTVIVEMVLTEAPPFPTKPIIGKAPPPDEPQEAAAAA